jgi:hypothetical protein
MVPETGSKWQDDGEPAVFQVSVMYRAPALLPLSLLLFPCALTAQTANASITGRVEGASKRVIEGAMVGPSGASPQHQRGSALMRTGYA